jgi:hypothetical protein
MKVALFFLHFICCGCFVYSQQINYVSNIKPIIENYCMPCHSKGNVGAMPLTTYKEVSAYAKMIQYVSVNKLMPPWKADPSFSHLKNVNYLSESEIALIKDWVNNGMEEGTILKNVQQKISLQTTSIEKPDIVFAMKEAFVQAADYTDRTQVFVIPTNFREDMYIEGLEFVAGNKKIVKSCSISIDTGTTGMRYDSNDLKYGYSSFANVGFLPHQYIWYQWTADMGATFFEKPYIKKIPVGSKILFHITYAASNTLEKDVSYLKCKTTKNTAGAKLIHSSILFASTHITNGPFVIDVDEKKKFFATTTIDRPIEIISVMPQGQYACYSWEIYAIDSISGSRINILKIPKWDAHWKKKYDMAVPIRLSAGSKIFGIAYYNNSEENNNLIILPPKKIKNGEATRDELFLVQYDVVEVVTQNL